MGFQYEFGGGHNLAPEFQTLVLKIHVFLACEAFHLIPVAPKVLPRPGTTLSPDSNTPCASGLGEAEVDSGWGRILVQLGTGEARKVICFQTHSGTGLD